MSWRLHHRAGVVLAVAKARAALLQIAHPQIGAGLVDHSAFEADPFQRVRRTGQAVSAIAFGSPDERHQALKRLHGIHSRIQGAMPDGTRYDATDPGLEFFVLATLIDSDLLVDEKYLRCLTDAQRAQYYGESLRLVDAFGIPRGAVPSTYPEFRDYITTELPRLEVSDGGRRIGDVVLMPRFVKLARPVVFGYRALMADLLPAHVREGFGLNTRTLTIGGPPVRYAARRVLRLAPRRLLTRPIQERPADPR